jgi:hypothetical protein
MARLEQDMASAEVNVTLSEDAKLASALGMKGTPGRADTALINRASTGAALSARWVRPHISQR